MHHVIQEELARGRQADLLREAERHRLALAAAPREEGRPRHRRSLRDLLRRPQAQQRPAPVV
jgi:hypothetical protein